MKPKKFPWGEINDRKRSNWEPVGDHLKYDPVPGGYKIIALFTSLIARSAVAAKEMVSNDEIKSSKKAKNRVGQRGKPEPPSR